MKVVGLFAGIGGIERGFELVGYSTEMLCEIDDAARRVLEVRFPGVDLVRDVRMLRSLPRAEVVAAGFPCQDLSQAGRTAGINGPDSGVVSELFRLLDKTGRQWPRWLVLENVPFMLHLERGEAMRFLTRELESRGFRWAYRIVDTRAFGLPHRRRRVILVASRTEDPRGVLFADDAGRDEPRVQLGRAFGFYWTEGSRGLGWAVDAVPTLKASSGLDISSPPAIWLRRRRARTIVTPEIRDGERLQGLPPGWTWPATSNGGKRGLGVRWRLLGNAVSVPVARWLGDRLASPGEYRGDADHAFIAGHRPWPNAAFNVDGEVRRLSASSWPVERPYRHLEEFLRFEPLPLSTRATRGFLKRARASSLRFEPGFLEAVARHLRRMSTGMEP